MNKCLICTNEFDSVEKVREHVLKDHPKALFTSSLKRKFVADVACEYVMGCQAQPLEWLDGEKAKSSTLLATLGPNDPINQLDAHNVWLDAERAIEHAEDCNCEICHDYQTTHNTMYEEVLDRAIPRGYEMDEPPPKRRIIELMHGDDCICQYCMPIDLIKVSRMGRDAIKPFWKKAVEDMEVEWHSALTCKVYNCPSCAMEAS